MLISNTLSNELAIQSIKMNIGEIIFSDEFKETHGNKTRIDILMEDGIEVEEYLQVDCSIIPHQIVGAFQHYSNGNYNNQNDVDNLFR